MAPKDQVVRLLMVEDSMETAEQLISALRNGGIPVRPVRAETAEQLAVQIVEHTPDIILVDAANKSPTLIETVAAVRKSSKDIPVVALIAEITEQTVIDAIVAGARSVVLQSRPDHLQMIVKREVADVTTRRAVRSSMVLSIIDSGISNNAPINASSAHFWNKGFFMVGLLWNERRPVWRGDVRG